MGALLALAVSAGSGRGAPDRMIALETTDDMATGSIETGRRLLPAAALLGGSNGGPCLRFPGGAQRGNC